MISSSLVVLMHHTSPSRRLARSSRRHRCSVPVLCKKRRLLRWPPLQRLDQPIVIEDDDDVGGTGASASSVTASKTSPATLADQEESYVEVTSSH